MGEREREIEKIFLYLKKKKEPPGAALTHIYLFLEDRVLEEDRAHIYMEIRGHCVGKGFKYVPCVVLFHKPLLCICRQKKQEVCHKRVL